MQPLIPLAGCSSGTGRRSGRPRARVRAGGMAAVALLLSGGCYTMTPREDVAWINYAPPAPLAADTPRLQRNRVVFDWVWSTVDTHYYDPTFHGVDWTAARARYRVGAEAARDNDELYGVINAMLDELQDGHTHALSPRAVEERRDRRWVWIGLEYATLKESPEEVVVTYVWPGGPAQAAGVRRGWILATCDGQGAKTFLGSFLRDRHLEDGQQLKCVFRDEQDQAQSVGLVARPVFRPPVREVLWFANRCVYLRFDGFKAADTKWLYEQMRVHQAAPAAVLDLRYNTGGDVDYLEYIAGLFLPRGQSLGTFLKRGLAARAVNSRRPLLTPRYLGRVAIIASRNSASAAEIFVSAMKHDRHSLVVGQKTAGEVLNAFEAELPDGGKMSVSIRDFRTPDGRRLEGAGAEPDAAIIYHLDDLRAGRDPAIDAALEVLRRPAPEPDT